MKNSANPEIRGHEHEFILCALQSGDLQRAEAVMCEHVMPNAVEVANCLPGARLATGNTQAGGANAVKPVRLDKAPR
jgi:hypothetical protein